MQQLNGYDTNIPEAMPIADSWDIMFNSLMTFYTSRYQAVIIPILYHLP
jgi:hypothetical protein